MPVYRSIRIQMPDRPGALSAISTALAVQGVDIIRLDIVGHNGGMVVDDLLVAGPSQEAIGQAIGSFQTDVVVKTFEDTGGDPTLTMADGLMGVARSPNGSAALESTMAHARKLGRADAVFVAAAREDGGLVLQDALRAPLAEVPSDDPFVLRWILHRQTAAAFTMDDGWAPANVRGELAGAWVALAPLGAFHVLLLTRMLNIPFLRDELERIASFAEVAAAVLRLRGDVPASGSMPAGKEMALPAGALTLGDMVRA